MQERRKGDEPSSPHQGRSSSRGPAGRSRGWRGLLRRLPWEIRLAVLATVYLGPPLALLTVVTLAYYTVRIPDPMSLRLKEQAPVVRVLARDGSLLSERGGGDAYVPIDLLPRHLVDAVIATEDRRFFKHWGLDPAGMIRAAFTNMSQGRVAQGGSTLTQQLAKNLFLGSERTWSRKLEEVVLALWLEVRLGKRNILELYLNRVYFGAGAYGVETAAQRFFAKSARDLTLVEAAMLAGLLKAPSKYSPTSHPPMARERANSVLTKMVDAGLLSAEAAEKAADAAPHFADRLQRGQSGFDYAVDAALERLPLLVAAPAGDLVIETTIDANLQRRAQALVSAALTNDADAARVSQAGLVLMDVDGGIRALIGGRSYVESQFNRALKARRQPGSTFKMFVYLAALESGLTPDSTVLDLPILGSGWSPRNEGAGYRGSVSLRDALALSMNAAAARLNMTVGPRKTAALARRLGVRSALRADASLALGTSEVTLLELTSAYGVLANGGKSLDAHIVKRVRTTAGAVLFERRPEPAKVLVAPAARGGHDRHARRRAHLGDGQARGAARLSGRGQDRDVAGFPRRLVRRLHAAAGRRRLGRQRRWPVHEPGDGRQPAGAAVARRHADRARGSRGGAGVRHRGRVDSRTRRSQRAARAARRCCRASASAPTSSSAPSPRTTSPRRSCRRRRSRAAPA